MVHISLQTEFVPPYVSTSQTLVNHETPLISEEESMIHFAPCPPPFSVPLWVPPHNGAKVGNSRNQIPNPYLHHPSSFHDSSLTKETP